MIRSEQTKQTMGRNFYSLRIAQAVGIENASNLEFDMTYQKNG